MKIVSENEWPGPRNRGRWAELIQWIRQGHIVMVTPEDYLPQRRAVVATAIYAAARHAGTRVSLQRDGGNIYVRLRPTDETTGETK